MHKQNSFKISSEVWIFSVSVVPDKYNCIRSNSQLYPSCNFFYLIVTKIFTLLRHVKETYGKHISYPGVELLKEQIICIDYLSQFIMCLSLLIEHINTKYLYVVPSLTFIYSLVVIHIISFLLHNNNRISLSHQANINFSVTEQLYLTN